jgi:hypothetical protein
MYSVAEPKINVNISALASMLQMLVALSSSMFAPEKLRGN